MRRVVADQLERAGIVAGDDLDAGIALDRIGEIGEVAVEGDRHRLFGERFGNAFGDRASCHAGIELANGIVGKRQFDHRHLLLTPAYERG